jgi:hypothetical protein
LGAASKVYNFMKKPQVWGVMEWIRLSHSRIELYAMFRHPESMSFPTRK